MGGFVGHPPAVLRGRGQLKRALTAAFDFTKGSIVSWVGGITPSFTRATTKTSTDWEGLPKLILSGEVPFEGQRRVRNLVLDSENLLTANWSSTAAGTGTAASATAGFTAPDGTNTAYRIQANRGGGGASGDYSFWSNAPITFVSGQQIRGSIWIKSNTGSPQNVALRLTGVDAGCVVVATTTWQRVAWSNVYNANGPTTHTSIGTRGATFGDQAIDVLVWHPQGEEVTGQSNQNPSEYVPVGAAKLNELVQTDALDQSPWTISSSSVTPNTTTAPDGSLSADTLTSLGGSGNGAIIQQVTLPTSQAYTISGYFKAGTSTRHALGLFDNVGGDWQGLVRISWAAGVPSLHSTIGAVNNLTITDVGSGWYRVSFDTVSDAVNTSHGYRIYPDTAAGTETVIAWGTQLVRGTALTSYVQVGNVYPYYGACVDGVKYFQTLNGNTVSNNVVTEATGDSIPKEGVGHGWIPGLTGSYFSTPDSVANSVIGDIDIRAVVAPRDWTTGGDQYLISHGAAASRTFVFGVSATGTLIAYISFDGTTWDGGASKQSTVAVSFADGTVGAVRMTRSSATGTITFFTSNDNGASWTALGATVASPAGALFNSSAPVEIGAWNGGVVGTPSASTMYRAQIYNGINGSLVLDFNPTNWTSGNSFTSSATGETWTLNGGAKVNKWPNIGYKPDPAATNLVLQSENFGTTWVPAGTQTRSAAAARCGVVVLDLLTDTDAAAASQMSQPITFTSDAVKSFSIFIAQGTSARSQIGVRDDTAGAFRAHIDLTWTNGIPVPTMVVGTLLGLDYMGAGVFRIRVSSTSVTAANAHTVRIYMATDTAFTVATTGGIYVGGVMAENSSVVSPYIPTTVAPVSVNADVMSTPTGVWFNPLEGTIVGSYVAANSPSLTDAVWTFDDGTANERLMHYRPGATQALQMLATDGGVTVVNTSTGAFNDGAAQKSAYAYKQDDFAASNNGGAVVTDNTATLPTVTKLEIGCQLNTNQWRGGIRTLDCYQTRFPNTVLQSLSAP